MRDDARELPSKMGPEELRALRAYYDVTDTSPDLERAPSATPGVAEPTVDMASQPVDVRSLIRGALDDVMVGIGFTAAQLGDDSEGSVEAIFCASNTDLLAAYPGLPVPVDPDSHACTDFTVETSAGHNPRVIEACLEGEDLKRLVVAIGRSDLLPAANAVHRMPLEEALSQVATLVREVFATAASPSGVHRHWTQ